jgi:biopolymer transport protein ExbD
MAMSGGRDDGEPMMEMNTTPLIDVMLFIITLPIPTHAVKVDLPVNSKTPQNPIDSEKNKVTIAADGAIAWNGSPVNELTLRQYLDTTAGMNPEPELHFQPDPTAKYEVVDRVLAVIKRSNVTKLGFIGNEQYRNDF